MARVPTNASATPPSAAAGGPIRLGIYLDGRNPEPWRRGWREYWATVLGQVERAEELGLGGVWLSEHHGFEDGYLSQPLVLAAAIAARTTRIRIGTAVLLLPLRRPRAVAEEAALLAALSGGRLELGLGSGYLRNEFAAFGADHAGRFTALEEGARELRTIWAGPGFEPRPADPVPLWLGHGTAVGARRAGRLRAGLLSLDLTLVDPYVEALEEAGGDRREARMAGVLQGIVARDPERTWTTVRPHLAHQWNTYRAKAAASDDRLPPPPLDPERWRRAQGGRPPRFTVYTPDDLLTTLRAYEDTPVEEAFLWLSIAGMPDELVEEHLDLLGEVAHRLRTHR